MLRDGAADAPQELGKIAGREPSTLGEQPAPRAALDDGREQAFLGSEVPVDGAGGQPGCLGDQRDARRGVAALSDQVLCGIQDALARIRLGGGGGAVERGRERPHVSVTSVTYTSDAREATPPRSSACEP